MESLKDKSCQYSFDDLHRAANAKPMSAAEKAALYALPQTQRNLWVRQQVARSAGRYSCEDRRGADGILYTAFWAVD